MEVSLTFLQLSTHRVIIQAVHQFHHLPVHSVFQAAAQIQARCPCMLIVKMELMLHLVLLHHNTQQQNSTTSRSRQKERDLILMISD